MTQEEKAERYDEVLEELRGLLECIHEEKREILEEDITSIFPELKESSDERIRQELIAIYSVGAKANMKTGDIPDKDIVAWLEKQGDHANFRNKIRIGDKVTRNENGELVNPSQLKRVAKPTEEYNITGIGSKNAQGKLGEMIKRKLEMDKQSDNPRGKTALEAINEEKVDNANKVEPKDYNSIDPHFGKPIDKVKPKFHKNEWIITKANNLYQVTAIIDDKYQLKYGDNYTVQKCADVDKCARLWDISDAKAGDVLYSPKGAGVEGIFLIKGWEQVELTGKTLCSSIGYRVEENEIVVSGLGAIWWEGVVDPFYPATKEQRDKFEKAMTDAGYTFDFEREELKNIEDEIEIPFGAKDSELIEESYYIPKGFHAEIDEDKVVIKKGEKPTAWSEEDENIKEWIMSDINKLLALNKKSFVIADKEINWLKSLKGRVGCEANCTTTKEWRASWEQLDALQYVCRNFNPPLTDKLGWDSLKTLELLYQDLNKL